MANYIIYIFFGIAPSIIWLLFYLRKDAHPEPNKMVLKIFFWGILATLPTLIMELGLSETLSRLNIPLTFILILKLFIGVALVEEIIKYLVVRDKVLKDPEFDEPVDAMIYMIIAALGFAALENILVLIPGKDVILFSQIFKQTITISFLRFVGATFLHALSSGLVGYFLALSFFETKKRGQLIISGLIIATILHGLFNFFIMGLEKDFWLSLVSIIILLAGLGLFVSFGFKKVKKLKSVCKIK
ncbi:MAG: PrsW family intramembrane metalloprotease [Candidatus Nealsonbacteria bacterium]|nr:PrsW family intramembrane metalloprotease [Candidatus Nealsonbacteria bacterium]